MKKPSNTFSQKSITSIHSPASITDIRNSAELEIKVFPARLGFSLRWGEKNLLSQIDPATQAEKAVAAVPVQSRTLYICPSPLFGYGLDRFLQQLPETSAIAAVEAEKPLFDWTAANINQNLKKNARFTLTFAKTPFTAASKILGDFHPGRFRRAVMLTNSAAWQINAQFYKQTLDCIQNEIALEWGNAATITKLGRLYARNTVRNLSLLAFCPNAGDLNFGRDSILVASAGPSLPATLENALSKGLLHRNSEEGTFTGERMRVVAVDTALQTLAAYGIKPDLAVALEAQHWNIADFTGLSGKNIPLAMDISALPRTAYVFEKPPYLFWTEWARLNFLERLKTQNVLPLQLPPLGSVGLTAYALARRLTAGRVICAGMDFSFVPCLYHCRDSPGHKKLLRELNRLKSPYPLGSVYRKGAFWLSSGGGKACRSDPALERYRNSFSKLQAQENNFFTRNALEQKRLSGQERTAAVKNIVQEEKDRLNRLFDILNMKTPPTSDLERLINECDYLWAHFPECAGKDGWRPPITDGVFLKRVIMEIEPFLNLLNMR
ncbi:MAG: DUF115 domain-containing protein [Spirochaetaceae bacterium]|nr:DUF115 domain-containing protein [Spirochaetaceae bacterium]